MTRNNRAYGSRPRPLSRSLNGCGTERCNGISSEALADEIDKNPNVERRLENVALVGLAHETVEVNDRIARCAVSLETAGYGPYDALHLACAEAAQVDVLLTTDDGFVRSALQQDGRPLVPARNPLSWSKENLL